VSTIRNTVSSSRAVWTRRISFQLFVLFTPPIKMEQSVPKCRHMNTTYEDGTECTETSAPKHHL
jgi:hypothetical protein